MEDMASGMMQRWIDFYLAVRVEDSWMPAVRVLTSRPPGVKLEVVSLRVGAEVVALRDFADRWPAMELELEQPKMQMEVVPVEGVATYLCSGEAPVYEVQVVSEMCLVGVKVERSGVVRQEFIQRVRHYSRGTLQNFANRGMPMRSDHKVPLWVQ